MGERQGQREGKWRDEEWENGVLFGKIEEREM